MELRELLQALHEEMRAAGVSAKDATANLAFTARRERDGTVGLEFVDAASMSKPREEELHRLQISLRKQASSVFEIVPEKEEQPTKDKKSRSVRSHPPSLPSKKG